MRTVILILLVALTLGAVASAGAYPVELSVTSNHAWMVADGKDTATITATVIQGTGEFAGQPLRGANVTLSVDSPWQLKDSLLVSDKDGIVKTTLLATKKSGTAHVTVNATAQILTETWGYLDYSVTVVLNQSIDHDDPSTILTSYMNKVQVMTPTWISVLVKDKWGNPVDNRNIVERVKFDAPSKGLSGFYSGTSWVKSITVPVNESGYADVQFRADPVGTNYVSISPPSPIKEKLISIDGISQTVPASVTAVVSPGGTPYPWVTVKTGIFTIGFTFYDPYGYPTMNQPVNITTNIPGESMSLVTNKNGMVIITYGPKDIAGIYTITAKAANNASVSASPKVEFVSGKPTDALLTASPQTMASRDVKDDITSLLTMRVVDQKGNPVAGETVAFRFKSFSLDKKLNQTMAPVLENEVTSTTLLNVDITAVSDENGDAAVTFHPGAFTTDFSAPGYNATASGSALVEAQWSTVKKQVTLTYINYPYLTVKSWVTPLTVKVNETVDVTVLVTGDGWALQPKPIDVLLLSDRSGSMLTDLPDRAVSVMNADDVFSSKLDYTRDRLGLVSFGGKGKPDASSNSDCGIDGDSSDDTSYALANYKGNGRTYTDNATLDLSLNSNSAAISQEISRLVPGGYTSMRYALKIAIDQMKSKARANAVKALVLLSDGDYNWYGDPLARGSAGPADPSSYSDLDSRHLKFSTITNNTQQNMAEYAKANSIRIFTIAFATSISSGGQTTLQLLANRTGGRYYYAPKGSDLAGIYTDIAGSLKDTAGVNTTMNLSFKNIMVDNATYPGNQVYNYTYIDGHSTLVDTWNASGHYPGYPTTLDSSGQWNKDRTINFFIGTVSLGQTWQSTVTLQVLKEGKVSIFDPTSKITVQDSPFPLKIPDAFITVLPNNSQTMLNTPATLHILDLRVTNPGSNTSIDLAWNLSYEHGMFNISEDIAIAPCGLNYWNGVGSQEVLNTTMNDTASIAFDDLPIGNYVARVQVNANDASPDENMTAFQYDGSGIIYPDGDPLSCTFGGSWPYGPGWPPGILSPGGYTPPPPTAYIKIS